MIKRYANDSPFNATERYLFVPVAAGTDRFESTQSGFVASVLEKYDLAAIYVEDKFSQGGFDMGETVIVGNHGGWVPAYALVFAGIHLQQQRGWDDAPTAISKALDTLPSRLGGISVATAGIPGTGFSGLKGNADIEAIRASLDVFQHDVVVYTSNDAFDREPRVISTPLQSDSVAVPL